MIGTEQDERFSHYRLFGYANLWEQEAYEEIIKQRLQIVQEVLDQFVDDQVGKEIAEAFITKNDIHGKVTELVIAMKKKTYPVERKSSSALEWMDAAVELCAILYRLNHTEYYVYSSHNNGFTLVQGRGEE